MLHCVSKNAPTLASCSFDNHGLMLMVNSVSTFSKTRSSERRATLRVIEYFAKSLKVIRNDNVEDGVYKSLLVQCTPLKLCISYCFWDTQRQKNGVTLKTSEGVVQSNCKRRRSIDHIQLSICLPLQLCIVYRILPRDAMHKGGLCCHAVSVHVCVCVCARVCVCVCVSVCLSVTFVSCVKTNKDMFEIYFTVGKIIFSRTKCPEMAYFFEMQKSDISPERLYQ